MTNIPYLSSWKRLVSGLKRGPLIPYDPGQNTLSEEFWRADTYIQRVRLVAVLLRIHIRM